LAVGCAIATNLTARDEEEMAKAEQRALESGAQHSTTWTNENGKQREYQVVAVEPAPTSAGQMCRRVRGQLTDIESKSSGVTERIYCRNAAGDWLPA
jgi:surface antigen